MQCVRAKRWWFYDYLIFHNFSVAATMPYWMYPHLDETQLAIQEKAKGDWKELTDDDRIQLYRAYFPVTFAEMQHPPSYGLQVFGAVFWVIAAAFPLYWLVKRFMLNPAPYQLHPDYMVSFSSGFAAASWIFILYLVIWFIGMQYLPSVHCVVFKEASNKFLFDSFLWHIFLFSLFLTRSLPLRICWKTGWMRFIIIPFGDLLNIM